MTIITNFSELENTTETANERNCQGSYWFDLPFCFCDSEFLPQRKEWISVNFRKEVKEESDDSKPNYEGLTQDKLAKRLSKTSTTVKNRIRDQQDERWCRDNDPEGLAW